LSDFDHFKVLCDRTLRSRNEVYECAVDLQHGLKWCWVTHLQYSTLKLSQLW